MKKLSLALVLLLVIFFGASAQAEEIILPDPGYYFGRDYDGMLIAFDKYPQDEMDAYVQLLIEQYGMEITEEGMRGPDAYVLLEKPGAADASVMISCYDGMYECGLEIIASGGIALSALETYETRISTEPGVVAWDDGKMIADPGDFLGYEIECFEIADDTRATTKGYMKYRYRAIPVEDILALADAFDATPYFESSGNLNNDVYWLLYFKYTGTDAEVKQLCAQGREEIGSYFRRSDLSIYIHDPYAEKSEFDIYEYPGFSVNSILTRQEIILPEGACEYCHGDGKCNDCGGTSWVWANEWVYIDGLPELQTVNKFCDAIYCTGGACSKCGGTGRK